MPPLRLRVTGTNDAPKTIVKDDQETIVKDDQEKIVKDNRGTVAKDDPGTVAKDDPETIAMKVEKEIPGNKPEAIPMNVRNEMIKQEVKGAISRKASGIQHRRRNTEVAKKIAIKRKDLATRTEISEGSEATNPILEKTDAPKTKKRNRFPKRRASVVSSPNFSANRFP